MAAWQKQQEQMAWLENADKTEAERLADYKATPEYIKRTETLAAWQAEQERKKQSDTWAAFRDVEKGSYTAQQSGLKEIPHPDGVRMGNVYQPAATVAVGLFDAWGARFLQLDMLGSGHISVWSDVPEGAAAYKANLNANHGLNLAGTRYLPQTVANNRLAGSVGNAFGWQAGVLSLATSGIGNAIKYGWGSSSLEELSDRTVKNQDYWSSTVADTVVGLLASLAAATIVSGTIALAVGVGIAAAATTPVWATIALTAVVAAGIGIACTNLGVNDSVKGGVDNVIDSVQSWFGG
jgi:hypothetical protein